MKTADVCREHSISSNTFYAWKSKYGGMNVSEAQRLRQLEAENAKLKRIVAEQAMGSIALKDLLLKTGDACCAQGSRVSPATPAWLLAAAGLSAHEL